MARQSARVQDDAINEDLLAGIPVVDKPDEATTFVIEPDAGGALSEEPMAMGPGGGASAGAPIGETLGQQLRYELGEALARELDRATETIAQNVRDIEARLVEAEAALVRAAEEVERERAARELAEKRLAAFKELALK